jgi:hypothetical protein
VGSWQLGQYLLNIRTSAGCTYSWDRKKFSWIFLKKYQRELFPFLQKETMKMRKFIFFAKSAVLSKLRKFCSSRK